MTVKKKTRRGAVGPGSGPKAGPVSKTRRNRVIVLFNDAELRKLKRAARKEPLSSYVRETLLKVAARKR